MSIDNMYHDGMRRLQDIRETRPIADRLNEVTVRSAFTEGVMGRAPSAGKPVDSRELVEAVRALGLYWLVLNIGVPGR